MTDPLYKSGTSLEKTDKEEQRDWLLNELRIDLSDEATLDLGKLKISTLKELREKVEERRDDDKAERDELLEDR